MCKGGSRVGERGAKVEAPQAGGVWGGGVPSPTGEGSGEGAVPLPRKFSEFLSQNGAFLCICSSNFGVRECLA